MSERPIGLVIPARNEEVHLAGVLECACAAGWLRQIVVVDDNSTDRTAAIAREFAHRDDRLMLCEGGPKPGKSAALLAGLRALNTDIENVMFIDADLIGVQAEQLAQLYEPYRTQSCDMAVAVFRHGGARTDASQQFTPSLNGQRCLSRWHAERALSVLKDSGYGAEIGLTAYARRMEWCVRYVYWDGVTHVTKEEKYGLVQGTMARAAMYRQVLAAWAVFRWRRSW